MGEWMQLGTGIGGKRALWATANRIKDVKFAAQRITSPAHVEKELGGLFAMAGCRLLNTRMANKVLYGLVLWSIFRSINTAETRVIVGLQRWLEGLEHMPHMHSVRVQFQKSKYPHSMSRCWPGGSTALPVLTLMPPPTPTPRTTGFEQCWPEFWTSRPVSSGTYTYC